MEFRALLIEWDKRTGYRCGGILTKDPGLFCQRVWQAMDVSPQLEIRLVNDDRDLSIYEEVEGVTVIQGEEAINTVVGELFPTAPMISGSYVLG